MTAVRRLIVTGRVQGVGYRDWFVATARALRLDGWVRNRADGRVEAVVSGRSDLVEAMIARAYDGPTAALVEGVTVRETPADETLPGFYRRPTC